MERHTPEIVVAEAINRVLAAESEAAGAIATAERDAEKALEAARERRRQILESARRRASRLHARTQQRLRQAIEELASAAPAQEADLEALRRLSSAAVERLATRLTSDDHGSR
jgi:vacuolar-type H+-ATPase subunit H